MKKDGVQRYNNDVASVAYALFKLETYQARCHLTSLRVATDLSKEGMAHMQHSAEAQV